MPFDPTSLASRFVSTLSPYVPGKPLSELEREYGISDSIKLASNENPLGMGALARDAIMRAVEEAGLYPDGNGFVLKQALARKHQLDASRITLGNGSNDLIVMLTEVFLTTEVEAVCSQFAFSIFGIAAQATGAKVQVAPARPETHPQALGHDLDAMRALVNERTRLVYIANPNNPTGTWVESEPLRAFLAALPLTTIVIVDEAYLEYVEDPQFPDAGRWLDQFPNLVVMRTFSKAYGLAALRVGYGLSHPTVADLLNRVRQPFNVNSLGLAAAEAALEDHPHLARSVALNRSGMLQLERGFDRLPVRRYPSRGNFILIDCKRPSGPVYEAMLRQGVIVRPLVSYRMPNHLRITVGTEAQNQRMLAALERALQTSP
jgi:histidinol-phosphate aminotransferase